MAPERLSREQSRLQTRERLLKAAAKIFSLRGYDAASVDEVAEEAGYSKGAVYSNFASKEELFLALLDRHLGAELQSLLLQISSRGDQKSEEFTVRGQSFPAYLEETRTLNLLMFEFFLYALRHPAVQEQLALRYKAGRHELTKALQSISHTQGDQAVLPPAYLAWTVIALGLGLSLQSYLEPGALPADLYSKVIERLLPSRDEKASTPPSTER